MVCLWTISLMKRYIFFMDWLNYNKESDLFPINYKFTNITSWE